MKPTTRMHVLKLFLFPLVFLALTMSLDRLLLTGLQNYKVDTLGMCNRLRAGQINAQVLVLGNSRAENSFDPRILSQVTQKSVYNMAWPGAGLPFQLSLLKVYLRYNQKPEYLIQEVSARSLQEATKELFDTSAMLVLLAEPEIRQVLNSIDPAFVRRGDLPLAGVNDTRGLSQALAGLLNLRQREERFVGFLPIDHTWSREMDHFKRDHPDGVTHGTNGPGRAALRELLALCRTEHIKSILVCTPEYCEMQQLVTNRRSIIDLLCQTAAEFGTPFWDWSDDPLCQDTNGFWNSIHLNKRGAAAFSTRFAERLRREVAQGGPPEPAPGSESSGAGRLTR